MTTPSNRILMIRPKKFGFNQETKTDNLFQNDKNEKQLDRLAIKEFDLLAEKIKLADVETVIIDDVENGSPDSVFPNNWICTNPNQKIYTFPMFSKKRRSERRTDIVKKLIDDFSYQSLNDLSHFEMNRQFLEGTGSIVLDHDKKLAYASISKRTSEKVLNNFCKKIKYKPIVFKSHYKNVPIYHTNVLMTLTENHAVICLDSVLEEYKELVTNSILSSGKDIIEISVEQMNNFCANILEVKNKKGESILIMSSRANENFSEDQLEILREKSKIIHSSLSNIEEVGGGSARCMICELF